MNVVLAILFSFFPQEAMAKDIAEREAELGLNLKAYLADAYLHPIFRSFEAEEEELVEVPLHQSSWDGSPSYNFSPYKAEDYHWRVLQMKSNWLFQEELDIRHRLFGW